MATYTFAIPSPRRAAWMAARARNAARRGGLVASIGFLAVAATILVLVLVPREVNRSVQARVDALPAPTDTAALLANLTGALDRLRNAESNVQSLRMAYADRVASATASNIDPSTPLTASGQIAEQSDARRELMMRVTRARSAPLVENFRAIGDADFLRNDAAVRVLLDSLTDVNRDREAYAALGGADARYAAMTARINTLGQRLLLLAEQRLGDKQASTTAGKTAIPVIGTDTASVVRDSARSQIDTTILSQHAPISGDTSVDRTAREALDTAKVKLQEAEKLLQAARDTNTNIARERERAEGESPARVPPAAMVAAALVLGLAVGYGVAFYREVKHPRIADAAEVERVTDTRVIQHTGATRSALHMRHRRQSDDAVAPVVDAASESYQLLHITLTGFGDTSREVEVVSNDALLGATVGVNLAAAAARDSRTTLLVDSTLPESMVARLLNGSKKKARALTQQSDSLRTAMVRSRVGREVFVDSVSIAGLSVASDELLQIAHEHDFTVIVRSDTRDDAAFKELPAADVILCVRVGVTSLDWLQTKAAQVRERNQRLRAVLLWATRAPTLA